MDAYRFQIIQKTDTIDFVKIGEDLLTPKPVILFCQGSLPIPLVIELENDERYMTTVSNFDYQKISEKYHIVLISAPFTPLIAKAQSLNDQYAYVTDTSNKHSYSTRYLAANYMEKYVERGSRVIDYIVRQAWVKDHPVYIVGHSQGAKIAVKIAVANDYIAALGFLSGNPLGRTDQFVRELRLKALKREIGEDDAQKKINDVYKWRNTMNENPERPSLRGEDSPRTVISFSEPVLTDLIQLHIPVFIGYGTRDIGALYCDLLPIDFIRNKKSNYVHFPYPGLEHNFMEVDDSDNVIVEKCHWDQVMHDFVSWLETLEL